MHCRLWRLVTLWNCRLWSSICSNVGRHYLRKVFTVGPTCIFLLKHGSRLTLAEKRCPLQEPPRSCNCKSNTKPQLHLRLTHADKSVASFRGFSFSTLPSGASDGDFDSPFCPSGVVAISCAPPFIIVTLISSFYSHAGIRTTLVLRPAGAAILSEAHRLGHSTPDLRPGRMEREINRRHLARLQVSLR